ncbi:hypothetical protein WME94_12345 [Sorangium sp. So ce429]
MAAILLFVRQELCPHDGLVPLGDHLKLQLKELFIDESLATRDVVERSIDDVAPG